MERMEHGGNCCGMDHIAGFGIREPDPSLLAMLRRLTDCVGEVADDDEADYAGDDGTSHRTGAHEGHCILKEVVLNNHQARVWHNTLEREGYKLVTTFRNNNSGNLCHVYHWYVEPIIAEGEWQPEK